MIRGWINYFSLGFMKTAMTKVDEHLRTRIRVIIWKQWKKFKTKKRKLIGLGVPEYFAHQAAGCRRGYWWTTNTGAVKRALTKERLVRWGFYDLTLAYQSVHVNY